MEITIEKHLFLLLFFAFMIVRLRGEEANNKGIVQDQNNATSPTKPELPQSNDENFEKGKETHNDVVLNNKKRNKYNGSGGGGGGAGWGWGGGGGGSNSRGGWGWGSGGGGGVYWRWGCAGKRVPKKNGLFPNEDFKIGEFAQCMVKGRCKGMRLDCPLHCGGPCFYDCRHMCKAHCRR